MPEDATQLARLRTRMLATAYSNADIWTQRTAFLTDQAGAVLARRDPAAAEALAASLLAPEILHDTQILGAAVEAGIDTSAWEERREKTRTYTRDAYELPPQFDPATEAKRILGVRIGRRVAQPPGGGQRGAPVGGDRPGSGPGSGPRGRW
ncbi:hypothetical protein [Streptomyces avermitilis]|uniref:hypothetical protein n=1 Tax=Streptomyces avermitilis TaxID=33903 RepID=UPI0033F56D50